MSDDYGSHADFLSWVAESAPKRVAAVETALREAFRGHIEVRETDFVLFARVSATDLAEILLAYPSVLKPLLSACNLAGRALARDLGMANLNTYSPRLNAQQAAMVAGYLKPFLPPAIAIHALCEIDRVEWIDKEIRRIKGSWESLIVEALNRLSAVGFAKRKFKAGEDEFEIDAASPESGAMAVAVDIKRIESPRDIHKRTDEILNKASHFKQTYPSGKFAAVIYYPFVDQHSNVVGRMTSSNVDGVVFAGQSPDSITTAVSLLLGQLGLEVV